MGISEHLRHCLLFLYDRQHRVQNVNADAARREICNVYGQRALSKATSKRWFHKFSTGSKELSDESRSGRPSIFDEETLKIAVEQDPRLTIRELVDEFNSSFGTIQRHLHAIGKVNFFYNMKL